MKATFDVTFIVFFEGYFNVAFTVTFNFHFGCETNAELSEAVTVQGGRMILLTPVLCDPEKASASWIPADYETA